MMEVGQKLYWVASQRYGTDQEVEVLKVGRKWAELSNRHRIDIKSMVADGGQYSPPGCCYLSKEAYEQETALSNEWSKLMREIERFRYRMPDFATLDTIATVREVLKIQK